MSTLIIPTARAFKPLLNPTLRFCAAHGGRGSGKSHFFAGQVVDNALTYPGYRFVCLREIQKSLKDSAYQLIVDKINSLGVSKHFSVRQDRILTPGGGAILFQGMQDHTAETIKSLEGMNGAWVEEAQVFSSRSWELLRPTIRTPAQGAPISQIYASWNPRRMSDPVDHFFRSGEPIPDSCVAEANWRDNPWRPKELDAERQLDRERNPKRYAHIWEGAYEPAVVGAIWDIDDIALHRLRGLPVDAERIVIGVDPAGSSPHTPPVNKRPESLPATGIVAVAKGVDGNGYVLADHTLTGNPKQWATAVVAVYDELEADAVVIETNYGGEMAANTIRSERPNIRIIEVRATRGKHIRAEPISALYHQRRVFHVGTMPELEMEMSQMTAYGYEGTGSPNRVDALVWALTSMFDRIAKPPRKKPAAPVPQGGYAWMG